VDSSALWKPNGIPDGELTAGIAMIKGMYPGLRIGGRVRPSQLSFNPGFDFYFAQYSYEKAPGNAGGWMANEYEIAVARNAFLIPSLNFLHGGAGDSGIRYANNTQKGQSQWNWVCSPAEVAAWIPEMLNACLAVDSTAELVAGFLGYQYEQIYFNQGDEAIDALVVGRNALASLPPL
jgi:hypothetical protein